MDWKAGSVNCRRFGGHGGCCFGGTAGFCAAQDAGATPFWVRRVRRSDLGRSKPRAFSETLNS
jgi:hypothetical protein